MRRMRGGEISMIFQEPMSSLNPVHTTGRQIGEAVRLHTGANCRTARERAIEMLTLIGNPPPENRVDEYPHQLSGEMHQPAMIAMALPCDPALLIADEPTTALDVTSQSQILDLLRNLRHRADTAILLITHDLGVVADFAERVLKMYVGRKVEEADVADLFAHPRHPYTQVLMQAVPKLGQARSGNVSQKLAEILGRVRDLTSFLSYRSKRIANRTEFGHWECDLMMFRREHGKVNVTPLVDHVSRYAVVTRNEDRTSKPIMEALINGLAPLPADARQSITFDRGTVKLSKIWVHFSATVIGHCILHPDLLSVGQKVQQHPVEPIGVFPLRPMSAAIVDMKLGIRDPGDQPQSKIEWHKTVVAAPDDQCLGPDLAQARCVIGKLSWKEPLAFYEILKVFRTGLHGREPGLKQFVGQVGGIVDKGFHHCPDVFKRRVAVQLSDQTDALCWHRGETADAAGAPAHQDQLAHLLGVGQCKGHCAMAAHRIAHRMHLFDAQFINQPLGEIGVQVRSRTGADDRIAFAPARYVHQDHAKPRLCQRRDVAVEVRPAGGTGAGAVQHHHHLAAGFGITIVEVNPVILVIMANGDETACVRFGPLIDHFKISLFRRPARSQFLYGPSGARNAFLAGDWHATAIVQALSDRVFSW